MAGHARARLGYAGGHARVKPRGCPSKTWLYSEECEPQDPPHLPPRSAASEARAGLCWPCPPGTQTFNGDLDLCLSPSSVQRSSQVLVGSGVVMVSGGIPSLMLKTKPKRRLLSSPDVVVCPAFASGPDCTCNPGFSPQGSGGCTPSLSHRQACGQRLRLAVHRAGLSLQAQHLAPSDCVYGKHRDRHGHCVPKAFTPRPKSSLLHLPGACGPGMQMMGDKCTPCPLGTYSGHRGMGSCLKCPAGWTTETAGSISQSQCFVSRVHDVMWTT